MATPEQTPYNTYLGNGVTTEFSIGFDYTDTGSVKVYIKRSGGEEELLPNTDYSFVNATTLKFPASGSSETVLANGDVLTVQRETAVENDFVFSNQKRLFPEDVMEADDNEMRILQEHARQLGRALVLSPTSQVDPDDVIVHVERVYDSIDNIDTVAEDISNVNIVAGDKANIDVVAGDKANIDAVAENKENIDTCATNMADIQAAPTAASNAASSAETAQKWAIGTIVEEPSGSAKYWAEQAEDFSKGLVHKEEVANRLTVIPQNIKLEISGSNLVLKAGSKCYLGDGTLLTIESDISQTASANGKNIVCVNKNGAGMMARLVSRCVSGAGVTTTSGFAFDTSTNKVNNYDSEGVFMNEYSLPIAEITVSGGAISSIDQIFNGFGYIGSTNFVLPGVKGRYPNGRDTDGTPKSGNVNVSNVVTTTGTTDGTFYVMLTNSTLQNISSLSFNKKDNIYYNGNTPQINRAFTGILVCEDGKVSSLKPIDVLGVVKYDDLPDVIDEALDTTVGDLSTLKTESKTNVVSAINELADDAQKIILTNLITAIPQNVKIEISNNKVKVKAGTKCYLGDGTLLTVASDLEATASSNGTNIVCVNSNGAGIMARNVTRCVSGDGATTTTGYALDTLTNKVNNYNSSGTLMNEYSLPIAEITVSGGVPTTVNQVFNGFGYIGKTVFVLPGVKGLAPNGRNDDGTLKNKACEATQVLYNHTGVDGTYHMMLTNTNVLNNYVHVSYDQEKNVLWNATEANIAKLDCGYVVREDGKVTELLPKNVYISNDFELPYGGEDGNLLAIASGQTLYWSPQGSLGSKKGKTVGVFGGSFAANLAANTYKEFEKRLGVSVTSYAEGSTGFIRGDNNFVNQATNADSHDIYIIWCSTNDWGINAAIGDKDDVYGTDNTIWASYKEVIRILYTKNPKAKICMFTTMPVLNSSQGNEEGYGTVTTHTNTVKEHVDSQKEMSAYYSIPCLDQYTGMNMNSKNHSVICKADGLHLTPFGYQIALDKQVEFLLSV